MILNITSKKLRNSILPTLSLVGLLLYFGLLNRHHLGYLEKIQLFRYNLGYLSEFFTEPGGFLMLSGTFFTQFFYHPWTGALLLLLAGTAMMLVTRFICSKTGISGVLFQLIPLFLLAAMHSHHHFPLAYSLGWLFVLSGYAVFLAIQSYQVRRWVFLVVFLPAYLMAGAFALILLLWIILHELLHGPAKARSFFILSALSLSFLVPYISWKYLFLIPAEQLWFSPVSLALMAPVRLFFTVMLMYFPLLMVAGYLSRRITGKPGLVFTWRWTHVVPGVLIYFMAVVVLFRLAYDRKTELFLSVYDHYLASSWEKVLSLSDQYPGNNQLILYFSNLALYKSGAMGDRMFAYKQSGTSGLWLEWKRNETAPFFGGEVFYQLGYNNEAFRWAFEAMEAKGLNPGSLKRLIVTSIINRDYALADKYLNYLDQTLFYRSWSKAYRTILADTTRIADYPELLEKRDLLISNDFIADNQASDIGLLRLLADKPQNRMAFEYWMASCLLSRNLDGIAAQIGRLGELGYDRIPVHYEEALLLYNGLNKTAFVPEGFSISQDTRDRFHRYATVFAANRHSLEKASKALHKDFGQTFWYYMQFSEAKSHTAKLQP